MDFAKVTAEYYSKWIGKDNILLDMGSGVEYIFSPERNLVQLGYSRQFDLFIFQQPDKLIISYGDKLKNRIDLFKSDLVSRAEPNDVIEMFGQRLGATVNHGIKYLYTEIPDIEHQAVYLKKSDYPRYLNFFLANNPGCKNTEWLEEYFKEMTDKNLCCGIYVNNTLVCCSDAPDMPYMKNYVQEIGINTLTEYRGLGYATDVCIAAVKVIIKNKKCPQWSTTATNVASQKLAEKIGFIKYADYYTVTL